jgi:hypothetical protein
MAAVRLIGSPAPAPSMTKTNWNKRAIHRNLKKRAGHVSALF